MLRIVSGPFHPDLEQALRAEVLALKSADPLQPLTIIVPSDALRFRLKWLLGAETGGVLLHLQVLTFYQLTVQLLDEDRGEGGAGLSLRRPFFFKEFISFLLRRVDDSAWAELARIPGAWAALWATLKDVKDAALEVDRVEDLVGTERVAAEPGLPALLTLYRLFLAERDRLGVGDQDDLTAAATANVEASQFLRRQTRILYYGFYDLTQVQLDLFRAISHRCPTTLYFPLVHGASAYLFAQRFFDRYLHGLIAGPAEYRRLDAPEGRTPYAGRRVRIIQTAGQEDEVTVVAKEILELVEERGYRFQEIGVVARSLTGYEHILPRVFTQQGVPFHSTMGRSLATLPWVKAALHVLQVRASGFRRDQVLEALSSPFVRIASLCGDSSPRLDFWELASRRVGITKGLEEWQRLSAFLKDGLPLGEHEDGEREGPRIAAEHIHGLWQAVSRLAGLLNGLPAVSSWADYAVRMGALWAQLLAAPLEGEDELRDALRELAALDQLGEDVSLEAFTESLTRVVQDLVLPRETASAGAGVQVLDAMAARGLPFRALFVLGLNEKLFPRQIQEDAFLRDRVRRLLEMDLGYKIPEKLAGYEEEALLFALLQNAAHEDLTLLYQRSDEAGRTKVPSSYLDAVRQAGADGLLADLVVPKRLTEKFQRLPQYRGERLTPAEAIIKQLLDRRVPRDLLTAVHPAGEQVLRGLQAVRLQESRQRELNRHDGITESPEAFWAALKEQGFSPTSLEAYARCPFRYFAQHLLQLEPLPAPESVVQLGPLELGQLAHRLLRVCLETLRARGYFTGAEGSKAEAGDPLRVLDEVAPPVFAQFAGTHPVGYGLLWELQQEALLGLLRRVLAEDLRELADGWEPVLFEAPLQGTLKVRLVEGWEEVQLSGRVDRVDWSAARGAYRIIDYKYKAGRAAGPLDQNLALGAVRGLRLQPPLYLWMAQGMAQQGWPGQGQAIGECLWFYYLAPQWRTPDGSTLMRVSFPGTAWTSELRVPLERAISRILEGIRGGVFFIYPGDYCEGCDYRPICRTTHQPTLWRLRADRRRVGPHRALRHTTMKPGEAGEAHP